MKSAAEPFRRGLVNHRLNTGFRAELGAVGPDLGNHQPHAPGDVVLPVRRPGPLKEGVKVLRRKPRRFQQHPVRGAQGHKGAVEPRRIGGEPDLAISAFRDGQPQLPQLIRDDFFRSHRAEGGRAYLVFHVSIITYFDILSNSG